MEIKVARELGGNTRSQISDIYTEGFQQWLIYFSKDLGKLSAAFAHMFLLDYFYVAVVDGKIAGITACTDGKTPPVRLDKKELRKHLGVMRGTFAYIMLKKNLENHAYPFPVETGTGSVEFVATAGAYRGKGVAKL